jgi:hypothetical protein
MAAGDVPPVGGGGALAWCSIVRAVVAEGLGEDRDRGELGELVVGPEHVTPGSRNSRGPYEYASE